MMPKCEKYLDAFREIFRFHCCPFKKPDLFIETEHTLVEISNVQKEEESSRGDVRQFLNALHRFNALMMMMMMMIL